MLPDSAEFSVFRLPDELTDAGRKVYARLKKAFVSLVEDERIVEVGDLCTLFHEERGIFVPAYYTEFTNVRLDYSRLSDEATTIPAGSVEDGSHAFEFISSPLAHKFVGFFFLQGQFGLFFPSDCSDGDAFIVRASSPDDFEYESEMRLGIPVQVSTSSADHLFRFGHQGLTTNYQRAIWGFSRCMERMEPHDKKYKRALAHLGLARACLGDFVGALAACNSALDSPDFKRDVYECRGTVHAIMGRFDEALSDITTAIESGSPHPLLFLKRAGYRRQRRDLIGMLRDFLRFAKIEMTAGTSISHVLKHLSQIIRQRIPKPGPIKSPNQSR